MNAKQVLLVVAWVAASPFVFLFWVTCCAIAAPFALYSYYANKRFRRQWEPVRCIDCGWHGRRVHLETILRLCPQCDGDRFEEVEESK